MNCVDPMGTTVIFNGQTLDGFSSNAISDRLDFTLDERIALRGMVKTDSTIWNFASDSELATVVRNRVAFEKSMTPSQLAIIGSIYARHGRNTKKLAVDTVNEVRDQVNTIRDAQNQIKDTAITYALGTGDAADYARLYYGVYEGEISEHGKKRQAEIMNGVSLRDSYYNAGVDNIGRGVSIAVPLVAGRITGAPIGSKISIADDIRATNRVPMSGLKRGRILDELLESVRHINADFRKKLASCPNANPPGNCMNSTLATELQWASPGVRMSASRVQGSFKLADVKTLFGREPVRSSRSLIESQLKAAGDDATGMVFLEYADKSKHAFNAIVKEGEVFFIDSANFVEGSFDDAINIWFLPGK